MREALRSLAGLMRRPMVAALLIGGAVFASAWVLRGSGWLTTWELLVHDTLLRSREAPATEPVVSLVWITEHEIQEYGHPLEDRLLVRGLEAIFAHRPRVVGIDVYRDAPIGEGWEDFARVFLQHPSLVIVEKLPEGEQLGVKPPSFLTNPSQIGFSDVAPDRDGVVRRGLLYADKEGENRIAFPMMLAMHFLFAEQIAVGAAPDCPACVMLGETPIAPVEGDFGGYVGAEADGFYTPLVYRHWAGFPSATFREVVEGRADPALFRDKIVVIGTASASVKDDFQIPSGLLVSNSRSRVWGAEVHAHLADQLVRFGRGLDRPLRAWSERSETLWILLWCLAGALLGVHVRSALALVAATAGGLGVLLGGLQWAFGGSWWLPAVPAAGGWLGSLGLGVTFVIQQERSDRRKMRGIFDKFMSPKLAESLWENREIFWHGDRPRPQRAVATILLSDLFGYTTRSEKAEPAEVMEWLGLYTEKMTELVHDYGGMVHDFLGDGLMASFGLPVPRESEAEIDADAVNAVECALAMGEALDELNEAWAREGKPTARLRVGLLTGPVVVGSIGGADRMKYAAVGDTVNTAARLEAFDKAGFEAEDTTCRVLVGEATLERIGDRFETRGVGDHTLKGKGEAVAIHRVLGRSHGVPNEALAPAAG